jgi:hypothetical protein
MEAQTSRKAEGVLDSLVTSAVTVGAPLRVAEEARRATAARFGSSPDRVRADRVRVESYFWGVVRRHALSGKAPAIARLIVAASLASELGQAGHAPEVVARALI